MTAEQQIRLACLEFATRYVCGDGALELAADLAEFVVHGELPEDEEDALAPLVGPFGRQD